MFFGHSEEWKISKASWYAPQDVKAQIISTKSRPSTFLNFRAERVAKRTPSTLFAAPKALTRALMMGRSGSILYSLILGMSINA
jgi:hypothetical protein